MKIAEIEAGSDNKLFESLHADNESEFVTEDLVSMVRTNQEGQWSDGVSAADIAKLMETVWNG